MNTDPANFPTSFPQYTWSLLIWLLPIAILTTILIQRKKLRLNQIKAIALNVGILAPIGSLLDILFGRKFFTFPNKDMILGIYIFDIPIEEYVFYFSGFLVILLFYIYLDEDLLDRYNQPDDKYRKYAKRIRKTLYLNLNFRLFLAIMLILALQIAIKHKLNPDGSIFPGYIIFLTIVAYLPWVIFYRVTRSFINYQALLFTLVTLNFISVIWEVNLALPRGFWNYNPDYMLGIFIDFFHNLPIEGLTVYIAATLIILTYEYSKIVVFRNSK